MLNNAQCPQSNLISLFIYTSKIYSSAILTDIRRLLTANRWHQKDIMRHFPVSPGKLVHVSIFSHGWTYVQSSDWVTKPPFVSFAVEKKKISQKYKICIYFMPRSYPLCICSSAVVTLVNYKSLSWPVTSVHTKWNYSGFRYNTNQWVAI